jgi:hypothetical protein
MSSVFRNMDPPHSPPGECVPPPSRLWCGGSTQSSNRCFLAYIQRVKLALAGEDGGGGARPPPLITFTITIKVASYAPAEWVDTLTLFYL